MRVRQRILSLLLCLLLVLSLFPAAYAETVIGEEFNDEFFVEAAEPAEEVILPEPEFPQPEEPAFSEEAPVAAEESEAAPEEIAVEADEVIPAAEEPSDVPEEEETTEEGETEEAGFPEDLTAEDEQQPEFEEEDEEELPLDIEAPFEIATAEGGDNDELLNGYAEQQLEAALPGNQLLMAQKNVGGRFTDAQALVYNELRNQIAETAAGNRSSTMYTVNLGNYKIRVTAQELGYDSITQENGREALIKALAKYGLSPVSIMMNALLADCPYELYWFDKTHGMGAAPLDFRVYASRIEIDSIYYGLAVESEYAAGEYAVNNTHATTIRNAVNRAQSIVASASALPDMEKLTYYKDQICALVSYNSSAASGGVSYGNPWQLIWVFDGDSSTNVVCEGYAKAFQYLCDLTSFLSEICSYTVSGVISSSFSSSDKHMWNIVTLDDGRNYLADVTNCDSGSIGNPYLLFLKPYSSGSVANGYRFNISGGWVKYTYDASTLNTYRNSDLILSSAKYGDEEIYDISHTSLTLAVNKQYQLFITNPSGEIMESASWSSSDYTVVYVNVEGILTARKYGTAVITATIGRQQYQCTVNTLFWDVADSEQYFFRPVYWAAENSITAGYNGEYFGPYLGCTRAQIVTFLWRLSGSPEPGSLYNPFTDVNSGDYFYKAVLWAYGRGITAGTTETTFSPSTPCRREQCVTFLWRAAGSPEVEVSDDFSDVRAEDYFAQPVSWALGQGITSGMGDGSFGTGRTCARGQIVTFLWRYAGSPA